MLLQLKRSTQFKKDIKKAIKQKKNINELKIILELLANNQELPEKNKDHALTGNYKGQRECHIEPDWLLIYNIQLEILNLVRLGSHSELFG